MSTDRTRFFPLLCLTNELLDTVLEKVDDSRSLRNVALTCRHLNDVVERHLYRKIAIKNIWGHRSFLYALKKKPDRAKRVHELWICRGSRVDSEYISEYTRRSSFSRIELPSHLQVLPTLTNLKQLYIKSFMMLPSEIHSIFARAAEGKILCSLTFCELHPVLEEATGEGWEKDWMEAAHHFYPVFRHPSLKHLILNNVIGTPGPKPAEQPPTPLERLEILNSELSGQGIKDAMTHSASLKELFICPETVFGYSTIHGTDYEAEAFAAVKNTLQRLALSVGARGNTAEPLELHDMAALCCLSVENGCTR